MTRVFELAADDSQARDAVSVDSTVGLETNFIFSYFESNEGTHDSLFQLFNLKSSFLLRYNSRLNVSAPSSQFAIPVW